MSVIIQRISLLHLETNKKRKISPQTLFSVEWWERFPWTPYGKRLSRTAGWVRKKVGRMEGIKHRTGKTVQLCPKRVSFFHWCYITGFCFYFSFYLSFSSFHFNFAKRLTCLLSHTFYLTQHRSESILLPNGETLRALPLNTGTKVGCPSCWFSIA